MLDTTVTVTPADEADAFFALRLLRVCGLPLEGVKEALARHYLIARVREDVTGLCGLEVHGRDGLLRSLAVDPVWRGRGIAQALLEATMARARAFRLGGVYLLTTTAHDYFARHGFVDCARSDAPDGVRNSWEFRTGCPESSALMRRTP